MAEINVERINDSGEQYTFTVEVVEEESKTVHTVACPKEYCDGLTKGKILPEDLIKKSFKFLLERESKEAILREFDLEIIETYFPEYAEEITKSI